MHLTGGGAGGVVGRPFMFIILNYTNLNVPGGRLTFMTESNGQSRVHQKLNCCLRFYGMARLSFHIFVAV